MLFVASKYSATNNTDYNVIKLWDSLQSFGLRDFFLRNILQKIFTSTRETRTPAIIPKACPASKVGAPHWSGYGIFILHQETYFMIHFIERNSWHVLFITQITNHGAADMRSALSVLQCIWVCSGWCLYAPLAVNRCAYAQITAMVKISANRSNIGNCFAWNCFRYYFPTEGRKREDS